MMLGIHAHSAVTYPSHLIMEKQTSNKQTLSLHRVPGSRRLTGPRRPKERLTQLLLRSRNWCWWRRASRTLLSHYQLPAPLPTHFPIMLSKFPQQVPHFGAWLNSYFHLHLLANIWGSIKVTWQPVHILNYWQRLSGPHPRTQVLFETKTQSQVGGGPGSGLRRPRIEVMLGVTSNTPWTLLWCQGCFLCSFWLF